MRAVVLGAVPDFEAPAPGLGATPQRWEALFELSSTVDVSVARLVEAHVDAMAILHEAERAPVADALYGVWASVAPDGRGVDVVDGVLRGTASFGSGIGIVDRVLVDARTPDGNRRLVDVALPDVAAAAPPEPLGWHHRGLASTATGSLAFDDESDFEVVGPPGWYLSRPGFWHGAVGPVACWAGAAAGLRLDAGDDPFRSAARGSMLASVWAMRAMLDRAGREADAAPDDVGAARFRARAIRRSVHEAATSLVDRFVRAAGPRPLVGDPNVAQRLADVEIYLRQHHDERELAELGR